MKKLFDHLKHITEKQTVGYWDTLNNTEQKRWSNYMTHRFLSMKMEWIDMVNEIQKYNLRPKDLYRLYSDVLPKGKQWLKYVKGKKDMKHPKWVLEVVSKYYESSLTEAQDYAEIFYATEQGKANLKSILRKYGSDPKEIKKLNLP
jgi:hypothetical protein|tara:strand:+ start:298 stop:735 length:438 start_codon:yes stop_codon:yes gene_type:complete